MPTQRRVFAGGSGSGKTTLLRALELRGLQWWPTALDASSQ